MDEGTSKDRKKAHELMIEYTERMLEEKSFSEANHDDKWVLVSSCKRLWSGYLF